MIQFNDLYSNHYLLYPNGDLVIYPIKKHVGHVITETDRKKARNFQLSYSKYRIISSAAIHLLKNRVNKIIFLTLTFNQKLLIDEKRANRVFNRFIKNFKKTYGCKSYIGTLEFTELGCPHYHFMFDFPFHDITKINSVWTSCISAELGIDNTSYSLGSVRLPKDAPSVVSDSQRVIRYICKYFSKGIGVRYSTRCYFISRELRGQSRARQITPDQFVYISDNLTAFRKYNFEQCGVFLYNPIEISELGIDFDK